MKRDAVRSLKRDLRKGLHSGASDAARTRTQESALMLLTRSIAFGHGRLALLRLDLAVAAGALVAHEQWAYCSRVALASQDIKLQDLYRLAAVRASQQRHLPTA
ncbi:hypothetical protein KIH07_17415 [Hydrogenophaga taeniospiralis]|uniref:hypothetical protein n=1 Tax=Hydrogenophaga TaxID=47420 RepID=UPI001CFA7A27|nr:MULTISPECIES: hypothetical protein [Hydrogenophaga]MCB4365521.1 hypothetical protein [Hydrogenophaga taeniospiralis]UJW83080.1 hypothetical protein IM738_10640 [Hydrogenophaga sp. SL48]